MSKHVATIHQSDNGGYVVLIGINQDRTLVFPTYDTFRSWFNCCIDVCCFPAVDGAEQQSIEVQKEDIAAKYATQCEGKTEHRQQFDITIFAANTAQTHDIRVALHRIFPGLVVRTRAV